MTNKQLWDLALATVAQTITIRRERKQKLESLQRKLNIN